MQAPLGEVIASLPGARTLGIGSAQPPASVIPDVDYQVWLRESNGGVAFGGALRMFGVGAAEGLSSIDEWNAPALWKKVYGPLTPASLLLFAEDAFGLQFGFERDGTVSIFWAETGEVERLGVSIARFFELVRNDPNGTISADLYAHAVKELGAPSLDQHFAFKVETALGGKLDVSNISLMNAVEHMVALGKIAIQLQE